MSIYTRLVAIAGLLLVAACPVFAQETTFVNLLSGKAAPLSLKLKALDGNWRRFTLAAPDNAADVLLKMMVMGMTHQTPDADVLYTHGATVIAGGETYLIAYRRPPQPLIPPAMARNEAPVPPAALTPETELALCLLNIRTMGSLLQITPFDLQQEVAEGGKTQAAALLPARRKAREASLKANLHQLRNALEQFQADCGAYPLTLQDLLAPAGTPMKKGYGDRGEIVDIPEGLYKGPYLATQGGIAEAPGIPLNPFVDMQATEPDPAKIATHWKYLANGEIHVPDAIANETTLDGIGYGNL